MLADVDLAYIAGLVDGEGCIGFYRNGARLNISNTHLETLEWIREATGLGRIWEAKSHPLATKPGYYWEVGARGMDILLPQLLPYLRIKRERALEFLGGRRKK